MLPQEPWSTAPLQGASSGNESTGIYTYDPGIVEQPIDFSEEIRNQTSCMAFPDRLSTDRETRWSAVGADRSYPTDDDRTNVDVVT